MGDTGSGLVYNEISKSAVSYNVETIFMLTN